jgi:hypothetical protein
MDNPEWEELCEATDRQSELMYNRQEAVWADDLELGDCVFDAVDANWSNIKVEIRKIHELDNQLNRRFRMKEAAERCALRMEFAENIMKYIDEMVEHMVEYKSRNGIE